MIMKNSVTAELIDEIHDLTNVINQAEFIVSRLEEENNYLKETLSYIYSQENNSLAGIS